MKTKIALAVAIFSASVAAESDAHYFSQDRLNTDSNVSLSYVDYFSISGGYEVMEGLKINAFYDDTVDGRFGVGATWVGGSFGNPIESMEGDLIWGIDAYYANSGDSQSFMGSRFKYDVNEVVATFAMSGQVNSDLRVGAHTGIAYASIDVSASTPGFPSVSESDSTTGFLLGADAQYFFQDRAYALVSAEFVFGDADSYIITPGAGYQLDRFDLAAGFYFLKTTFAGDSFTDNGLTLSAKFFF
ncbi:hypothetical protein [Ferrimonas pelagia]|uniref:Porin n=1 Tax=Ferrimonas pelagia TaxID=1177826 RepID=A0ABP9FDC3_9GAMM